MGLHLRGFAEYAQHFGLPHNPSYYGPDSAARTATGRAIGPSTATRLLRERGFSPERVHADGTESYRLSDGSVVTAHPELPSWRHGGPDGLLGGGSGHESLANHLLMFYGPAGVHGPGRRPPVRPHVVEAATLGLGDDESRRQALARRDRYLQHGGDGLDAVHARRNRYLARR